MGTSDKYSYLPKSSAIIKPETDGAIQLKKYKKHLLSGLTALASQFKKGTSIAQLLKARSALIDSILMHSWQQFSVDASVCLMAVGGYGRSELHPYSDIDILILLSNETQTENLESWIAFLWDIGLEVGHSVRTLEQCHDLASQDISVATNLMEARFICGEKKCSKQLLELVNAENFWPIAQFYSAKFDEHKARHAKFRDTSFSLEPNIKSNPGGLRDLHVMQWLTLKAFKTTSLHKLVELRILTRREYKNLLNHQQFLNRVRFALHIIAKKREDRLLFEFQKSVAAWLGYEDKEHKLAVEQLMQRYYRAVMSIRNLCGLFLQVFEQEKLPQNATGAIENVGQFFYIKKNRIGLKKEFSFHEHPEALISIFMHVGLDRNIKQIESYTLRQIRSSQHLLNKNYLKNDTNRLVFIEFLSAKYQTSRGFALMKRTNVLGALLPQFSKIEGQMQFDLFHAYTVDEHTLFLLRHLIRYNREKHKAEFPICSNIMARIQNHSVIHLAALFHDIGKGRGGDHSELGAIDALKYCTKIGLNTKDMSMVSWLVKHHLNMSMVAQRQDISDIEVISNFCKQIPSLEHLDLLYVLTVSDIRATNPTLWNSWKASLLQELYLSAKHFLSQSNPRASTEELLSDSKQQILSSILDSDKKRNAESWLNELGEDYILRYHPEQINWHLEQLNNQALSSSAQSLELAPIVAIKNHRSDAGTEILVITPDQTNLFAKLSVLISRLKLDVQDATLFTSSSGLCFDTFVILDHDGKPTTDKLRQDEICQQLSQGILKTDLLDNLRLGDLSRRHKHFEVTTQVQFKALKTHNQTQIEITALDRPALLAKIARIFSQHEIKIHAAKIVTLGEKAEDTFQVSCKDNQPLSKTAQLELQTVLLNL